MAQELKDLDKQKLADYWSYNIRLTTITMVIWFVVTYVAIFLRLNWIRSLFSVSRWGTTWERRVR